MTLHLITSALPYINGVKHLGNLAGSMVPADVHARFRRLQGHEVLFICATDEHGTPAELGWRYGEQLPGTCDIVAAGGAGQQAATGGNWARWWRADQGAQDVSYIQFMGKDNVA